jgi:hypothetical protein
MSKASLGRRRFLKYVGAGAVAVAGAVTGYYLHSTGLGEKREVTIPISTQTATSIKVNHPPVAAFKYKPHYVNPTDQQAIQFTNTSYDPDGDPLTSTWLVDQKVVSHEQDYSTKLPQGEHRIDLRVSDGTTETENITMTRLTVEANQIYPIRQLHVKLKGISIFVGPIGEWPFPTLTEEEMDEQLYAVRNDLGCNAVIISGGEDYEDKLIECGRMAIEKGFERIYIQPRYMRCNIDETVRRIGELGKRIRALTETSDSVRYCVGHEFGLETEGIIPGSTYPARFEYHLKHMADKDWMRGVKNELPKMFRRIVSVCKENYGYGISYAAAAWEVDLVPWSDPTFESVGVDALLRDNLGGIIDFLTSLRIYRKPILSAEWGCGSYKGAVAGDQPQTLGGTLIYDEDEQANHIKRYCDDVLNRTRIDGSFYTELSNENDLAYGLLCRGKRKKGFYMYKSYQRAS